VRFLADGGISPKTVEFLRQRGHDGVHLRELQMQRATDLEVVARARDESRVVLTFDLDFGEVLALGVLNRPSVIIFRLSGRATGISE
jgi:predicted nuclease of predicted toxin-antitoxin system